MTPLPFRHLQVFVATQSGEIPPSCKRFASVDGSVPGAVVTWDHHRTGELINLDAMPGTIDASNLDSVGTTLADTDALASVVAVMAGGADRIPPAVLAILRAASHRCDHLTRLPGSSDEADRLGEGLLGWAGDALAAAREPKASKTFARLCGEAADCIAAGRGLPFDVSSRERNADRAARLDAQGRITRGERIARVDLRGGWSMPPEAYYARFACPVSLVVDDHPRGGVRYVVGVNPFAADRPTSLRPALEALAAAEFAHGPPAKSPDPVAGAETWGGRATVFGSPWNYGSRLSPDEVSAILDAALRKT